MFDRAWRGALGRGRANRPPKTRTAARARRRLGLEDLESRQLLTAALAPIASITVPQFQGSQVPLDGSGGGATQQTYAVNTSNPDIQATVAQGPFLTFTVKHTAFDSNDISFNGSITYQLFSDLTPNTVKMIEEFVNDGYYVGKDITRVVPGFVFQGGAPNPNGTGNSGQPGTPFNDEYVQQLTFTGAGLLAMANTGISNTNDTQFFNTYAPEPNLNYTHPIFGQLVSGQNIVTDISQVETMPNSALNNENSLPKSPITITAATVANTNPNGVIHIDATHATAGESATITVSATDPTTKTTANQTFQVNVGPSNSNPILGGRPFLEPIANQTVAQNQTFTFQPQTVEPNPNSIVSYSVQGGYNSTTNAFTPLANATSTVNNSTGVIQITPTSGFNGTIPVLVAVQDQFNYGTGAQTDPSNFRFVTFTLTVTNSTTPVQLKPIANPIETTANGLAPVKIQLAGQNPNPSSSQTLSFSIVSQPSHGTISQFNAQTGTLVYTPQPGFNNLDSFQYAVTASGGAQPSLTSNPATVTITGNTDSVRLIGSVLVVTPPPVAKSNSIDVRQVNDPTNSANDILQVTVNGMTDSNQPLVSSVQQIVVYGGAKASNDITVEPSVTIPSVTLDAGHGIGTFNVVQAGSTPTREHGWFGKNLLIGGTGPNELIGRTGHVRVKPTSSTQVIFTGSSDVSITHGHHRFNPPRGTFYKFVNGRLVAVPPPAPALIQTTSPPTHRAVLEAKRSGA